MTAEIFLQLPDSGKDGKRHLSQCASEFRCQYEKEDPGRAFYDLSSNPSKRRRVSRESGCLFTLTTNTSPWLLAS